MNKQSAEVRDKLRAAETAVRAARDAINGASSLDDAAITDLDVAELTIRRWRLALETGKWSGRKVDRKADEPR
ncbi:MAG: hypothetical protein R3F35_06695 [Myxococcota bacterium]